MTRTIRVTLVLTAVLSAGVAAQEQFGTGGSTGNYGPGWTFTPSMGWSETYDDNITLFAENTFEDQNDDYISTFVPSGTLHYGGKHTAADMAYTGSFLNYNTFSVLDRWDQRARAELSRRETARLKWNARASIASVPTTDLVEFGGIPYRNTGAITTDARASVDYALNAKNSLSQSVNLQSISFDRPEEAQNFLRGGRVFQALTGWRRKMNSRFALGADYSFRRALVIDDPEPFTIHTTEAAVDYVVSPLWSLSGAAGVVHLQATQLTESQTGPALRFGVERQRNRTTFHAGYVRSYLPSFGFGGTVSNQELVVGYRTPLFGQRRLFFDTMALFRDTEPLVESPDQLRLRALRLQATVGWEPQPWVRLEGFYSRIQQSSLRPGGQLSRNRIGFQIVTSKPVRMQ